MSHPGRRSSITRISRFGLIALALSWLGGACGDGQDGTGRVRLDPATIPKYVTALVIPPVMEPTQKTAELTEYEIAVRQFPQQILPSGFPATTVWGYGKASDPLPGPGVESSFHSPSFTVEARVNEKVRVKWINDLTDGSGNFRPHLFVVDPTLHWANPPGPPDSETPGDTEPYLGPIPIVTHVHGAHVASHSDGFPEAWYLPDAANIPAGFFTQGTEYDSLVPAGPGAAVFEYSNDQRPSTLWYHDHSLGITRLNVYAGLAGFWLLRDGTEEALDLPGPAPSLGDPADLRYYEVPVAIQDRSFYDDGSLFYAEDRAFFDGYTGPFIPETSVSPFWNPEFFGDSIMVNGRTWPFLEVEPRLYRLRFLNGCNSRFLILTLDRDGMTFHQIGNEGGLLPDGPIELAELLLAPAERADVIIDFSGLPEGTEVLLLNRGPDEPFQGAGAPEPQEPADPETTGQVMQFRVVGLTGGGHSGQIPPSLPPVPSLGVEANTRDLTLNERMYEAADIPVEAELGTLEGGPISWDHDITEFPALGDVEVWRLINLTGDAHPIHLHLVAFEVLDRIPIDAEAFVEAQTAFLNGEGEKPDVGDFVTGGAEAAQPWEKGRKDTVIADPGHVTRIRAHFDLAGLYVWHCHILEHEDNEMMRPYRVVDLSSP